MYFAFLLEIGTYDFFFGKKMYIVYMHIHIQGKFPILGSWSNLGPGI
jgi:hypothetical protein